MGRCVDSNSEKMVQIRHAIVPKLFKIFDGDGCGFVDFVEISCCLSALCGGDSNEKAIAVFSLFDFDCNGSISREQMRLYLTSIFKLVLATQPEKENTETQNAEMLAEQASIQAFNDAGLNPSDAISFEDFKTWLDRNGNIGENPSKDENLSKDENKMMHAAFEDDNEMIHAAFRVFDKHRDGVITKEETFTYLSSVFQIMYRSNPGIEGQIEAKSEELARATTDQAFLDLDVNDDGVISYQQFSNWCAETSVESDTSRQAVKLDEERMDMKRAQWLLNLDKFSMEELLQTLMESSPDGVMTLSAFTDVFENIIKLGDNCGTEDLDRAKELVESIYVMFDPSAEDSVDFSNLASGLSVLCDAPMEEKINFAFSIYDMDRDSLVVFDEIVEYLASVFKVLFITAPAVRAQLAADMTPTELAESTAELVFEEAGLDEGTKIGISSFHAFVVKGLSF